MSYLEMRDDKLFPVVHAAKKGMARGPISLQIGTTHTCINRCVMCQHWTRPNRKRQTVFIDKKRLSEAILDPFSEMGGDTICYSGGEAMEHPTMLEIIQQTQLRSIGVGLITSGTGRAFRGDLGVLRDCEWVRVSLDAVQMEIYQLSRGPGFYDAIENVKRMLALDIPLGFGITVHKRNIRHIPEVLRWIQQETSILPGGVRLWLVRGEKSLEPDPEDRRWLVGEIQGSILWKTVPDNNISEFIRMCLGDPELPKGILNTRCGVPLVHLYIDASLRGFPCCIYAGDAESDPVVAPEWDFSKVNLAEVWQDILAKEASKFDHGTDKKACQGCTLRLASLNQMIANVEAKRIFV